MVFYSAHGSGLVALGGVLCIYGISLFSGLPVSVRIMRAGSGVGILLFKLGSEMGVARYWDDEIP